MPRIYFTVSINPVVGRIYRDLAGLDTYQVSKVFADGLKIEIIPTSTSEPRIVTAEKFFWLFGTGAGH